MAQSFHTLNWFQNVVLTLIGVCDAILYRTILKVVLPSPIQVSLLSNGVFTQSDI
jgi:hypothetical protein